MIKLHAKQSCSIWFDKEGKDYPFWLNRGEVLLVDDYVEGIAIHGGMTALINPDLIEVLSESPLQRGCCN